ncbi:HTH_Tnp_Tc3_2 domain-containing protein [Trichonephila clavipes]|nr:HTH_Tnp_Tc3_2 domain-containing protein [Trichonephila clavipes]
MMEAGWSARQVARQLGRSDCVVRRCWDQWIREISFTQRPVSGRPRQTSRLKERHLVRHTCLKATASSPTIQAQVALLLGTPVSTRTIRRRLAEGHLGSHHPLRVLPLTPTHQRFRLESCRTRGNWTAVEWNRSSLATNPESNSAVMTIAFVCGDPVVNASILPLIYSDTPLPQLV